MEADKVIEEPQTTMDAEEHPSSKDPSAEDSQEPLITETPLEPSISETPLEPLTPETLLEPSTSQTPLETHTSETSLKPSIPQTSLEPHAYETLLEPSTSKASTPESPLESHISKVPEKHLSFHNSSPGHSSMSSSDTLKEDFFSESSSRKPSWRRSAQTSESEILEQHSLSGPSAQVHLDTSAKEREEDEEKEEVDTSIGTTHTAQPGRHPGKKKKGISRYKAHPVVPAKQAELVEVAKAMHREKFGAQVNNLFQWEKNAALNAIQTGLYIGWRCPHYLWDCFRIGDESKCFCGHLLREHQIISDISVPCNVGQCRCLMFCFIPSRPEEVGEFWLKRRATFDPKAWRAQCRCKHSHEDHAATRSHPCRVKGCCCNCFESNFLCAACDRRWEEHETFFETEETRRRGGRPHGADYVPFAEMPTLRETIISNSDFKALQKQGPSGQRSSHPSPPGLPGSSSLKPGPTFDPRT
ncbi:protein FAM221B isoform X1 [Pteropus medius]|uniref:Protein FAM221B isoform X1 n=1 Tax=Pteropus vampyrus TaxID=132908 RepID=A0A6P6BY07_PTEVA|nr:protein FAM221B isoform X1 [Pteropus vampyrus]XP_039731341.1 protein FAM221B isoform X1 [Pteropus giganteus]